MKDFKHLAGMFGIAMAILLPVPTMACAAGLPASVTYLAAIGVGAVVGAAYTALAFRSRQKTVDLGRQAVAAA